MHARLSALVALALAASSALLPAQAAVSGSGAGHALRAAGGPAAHRRHHAAAAANPSLAQTRAKGKAKRSDAAHLKPKSSRKKRGTCKAGSSSSTTSSNSTTTTTTTSSNSSALAGLGSSYLAKNGLYWGFLPDEGDAGGSRQTMAEINSYIDSKSAFYGYYAQAQSGTTFTGSQLTSVLDDVKSSGAIFQPAIMPTGGWEGLTSSDNSQAVAIAKVLKQFTDEGIEVWLRFAHEVNWYQTDGTYSGDADDFKAGWAAVSDALDEYAPDVKMWFTPNIASLSVYESYYPTSGRVDLIGIDYYPSSTGTFVSKMQDFHDKYCSEDGPKFAIGETGWGQSADIATRLAYVEEITSDATLQALPYFIGASWFNFYKGYDFRIVTGDDSTTSETVSYFTTSS